MMSLDFVRQSLTYELVTLDSWSAAGVSLDNGLTIRERMNS
jgi:hypothetical protein